MSDDVKSEVEEMNKMFDSVIEPEKPPEPEPKVEPKEEEPKVEEPKAETPPKEEPKEEPKQEEKQPDDLAKTIETLRLEIAELKAKKAETPSEKKEPEPKPTVPEITEQDFVGDLDLDEVSRDPKKLNEVFNNVYKKARTDSEQALISSLPERISAQINAINTLQKATEDFYTANEDLKPFKKVVSMVFQEVMGDNPTGTLDELLSSVSTEVRKRLELPKRETKKEEVKEEKKQEKPPNLPKKGASAGKSLDKPETDPLQSQLDEMNKALRS